MIQTTVVAMLKRKVKNYDWHYIYVVREDDLVFYVGLSLSPIERMIQHVYGGRNGIISHLGHFIRDNIKYADNWQVDLLTLEECKLYIDQYGTFTDEDKYWNEALSRSGIRDQYWLSEAMRAAEGALIQHYCPCLNVAGNPNPNPLPSRYITLQKAFKDDL